MRNVLWLIPIILIACTSTPPDLVPKGPGEGEPGGPGPSAADLEALKPFLAVSATTDYGLYPGDLVRITVQGNANLTIERRIPANGKIPIYLEAGHGNPVVQAAGKQVPELEAELSKHYAKVVSPPYVTVTVLEYAPKLVYIAGAVKTPREYRLPDDKRISLVQALTMAGWFAESAAEDRVRVIRVDKTTGERVFSPAIDVAHIVASGRVELDILLSPGDTITVDSRANQTVYIFGHVREGGVFPWERGMTLTRLITLGGGLEDFAKIRDIRVIRAGQGPKPVVYHINLQQIFDGEAVDFPLQPGDRVWVDETWV